MSRSIDVSTGPGLPVTIILTSEDAHILAELVEEATIARTEAYKNNPLVAFIRSEESLRKDMDAKWLAKMQPWAELAEILGTASSLNEDFSNVSPLAATCDFCGRRHG